MTTLTVAEINEGLRGLKGWKHRRNEIWKSSEFQNFKAVMNYVDRVAEVAEEQNHHPLIEINYNQVTLKLTSHFAGGVTHKDLLLAEKIDAL